MKADAVRVLEEVIRQSVGTQYIIPVYQRNYTWKAKEQVKMLIEDLKKLIENESKIHFIGTIVYVVKSDTLNGQERSVVDGQQRLITIFLMLYAIRHIARKNNDYKIANYITNTYLENTGTSEEYKLRLKPTISDDNTFINIANDALSDLNDSESNVYTCFKYILEIFGDIIKEYSYDIIIKAMQKLYVVYIRLDNTDDPQQIFESINSTGMELTSADLIRNYILMDKSNIAQERIYKKYWIQIENRFKDSKKLEIFLRLYLSVKNYTLSSKKNVYSDFKVFYMKTLKTLNEDSILEDINNYSRHYSRLYSQDLSQDIYSKEIKDYRMLQSEMPAPFIMKMLELERKKKINVDQMRNIFELTNNYLVRRYLCELDTSSITRFFPQLLKNIMKRVKTENSYDDLTHICLRCLVNETRQKSTYMPNNDQMRQHLLKANAYSLKLTKWILMKVENSNSSIPVNENLKLTIEHIMPQKQNEYWLKISGLSTDEYERVVNRIGNLTLTSRRDNSKMSNKDFESKKEILKKTSHLKLNEKIILEKKWNVDMIEKRTQELIDSIIRLYPYRVDCEDFSDYKREVVLKKRDEIVARAYYNSSRSIEILAGSTIRLDKDPYTKKAKSSRENYLNENLIKYNEIEKKYILTQHIKFTSLSTAAEFILGGSVNGWDVWYTLDGVSVKTFKED